MKKLIVALFFFGSMSSAHSEMIDIGTYGYWSAFGGKSTEGSPMCEIATSWTGGGSFMIKTTSDNFFIHLFKNNWNIPSGTRLELLFQVDNSPVYTLHGFGNGHQIEVEFKKTDFVNGESSIVTFTNLMMNGNIIKLGFPNGSEPIWSGSLEGSRAALSAFADCYLKINQATQPFTPKATQPFGTQSLNGD